MSGIDPARLDVLVRRVRLEVDGGTLPSAQLAVAKDGRLVHFETYGRSSDDRRYILQSCGRTVVAGIVWKLIGDGKLGVSEKVADIIPEFGTNGKEIVTVEQVLTHTAGLPYAPLGYPDMLDRGARLEAMSKWRLTYEPGSQLQYHLTSAAWILGEVVERRTGRSFPEYLHTEIAAPLGLSLELGVQPDRQKETVAMPIACGQTAVGEQVDPWGPWYTAKPEILASSEPSHSMVGTAADLALFFQALYHADLWAPGLVDECIRARVSMAPAGAEGHGGSDVIATLGLFVTLAGTDARSWVPATGSPRTFGNAGAPCQLGFMDPDSRISFAFLTNGYPPSGYDRSRAGLNRIKIIGNLAMDLPG